MYLHARKSLDLAAALRGAVHHAATQLTAAELVRAFSVAHANAADMRLKKWLEAIGTTSAWEVTSEQLQILADAMIAHGYKSSSVNRDLSELGGAYRWALRTRQAPRGFRSPTVGVPRFTEEIRRVHVEEEKVSALLARSLAFRDRRFGVLVHLLHDTGARKSELLLRRWSDVDLERLEILAPTTKNGTPRVLLFQPRTADLIRRAYPTRHPDKLLFEGRAPGQPGNFRKLWATATKDAGLPGLHMHDLRHIVAARLLRAGTTLAVAAQVLGHDPQVLARRYGHLETGALRRAQEHSWGAGA
jgi:integrase